jgi:hypothetical protein
MNKVSYLLAPLAMMFTIASCSSVRETGTVTGVFAEQIPDSVRVSIPAIHYDESFDIFGDHATVKIPICLYSEAYFQPKGMPKVRFISDGTDLSIDYTLTGNLKVTSADSRHSVDHHWRNYNAWYGLQCDRATAKKEPLSENIIYKDKAKSFIITNNDNIIAIYALRDLSNWAPKEELQPLIEQLSPKLLRSDEVKHILAK